MDTSALAAQIAQKVVNETSFWIATVGLIGVLLGSAITVGGNILLHWLKERQNKRLEQSRKKLLLEMLRDSRFPRHWRQLSTLSRVIGADEETTKRLLIDVGARGSEKDDGLWGLIEYHSLQAIEN